MRVSYVVYFGDSKRSFVKEKDAVQFYCDVLRSRFVSKIVCVIEFINGITGDLISKEIVLDEFKGEKV